MTIVRLGRFGSVVVRLVVSLALTAAFVPAIDTRLAPPPAAWAAGYVVNQTADPGDGVCDGTCTLRDAVLAANANAGPDTITFDTSGAIVLGSALPAITDTLTIDGSGHTVAVDGANAYRVISATAALTLTALTVQNGYAAGNGGGAYLGSTGTISGVTFISNTVNGSDDNGGGGAWFADLAWVTNSTFAGNTSSGTGGGAHFEGAASVSGTDFIVNTADGTYLAGGGALFWSPAQLTTVNFVSNTTAGYGGGAMLGEAELSDVAFIGNSAFSCGGACVGSESTLSGTSFISNSAQTDGGGAIFYGDTVTITATTFMSNTALSSSGGARFDGRVVITGSTFIGNSAVAYWGGGATLNGNDSMIQYNLFQANTSGYQGAGLYMLTATNIDLVGNRFIANLAGHWGATVQMSGDSQANLDNNVFAGNTVLTPTGAVDIGLEPGVLGLTGRHNTFAAAMPGQGLALQAGPTTTVALTNTIFDGYEVAVQAGAATTMTLDGVLWSNVTTPTQGAGITVTNDITGSAAFADPGAHDYHLTQASDARDAGVASDLSVDFEGDSRSFGPAPDLGADEYTFPVAPVAGDDTANTPEDTALALNVLANDSDLNGDTLSVGAVEVPTSGMAVVSGTTQIVYTPALNFNGAAVFTYTASDGALMGTATVTITVTPVNDDPTIAAPGDLTITVNSGTGAIPFTVGDVDEGDVLTVTTESSNTVLVPNGSILLGGSGISRTVTITPAAGQWGAATITLTVDDGQGGMAQGSFGLTVIEHKLYLPLVLR